MRRPFESMHTGSFIRQKLKQAGSLDHSWLVKEGALGGSIGGRVNRATDRPPTTSIAPRLIQPSIGSRCMFYSFPIGRYSIRMRYMKVIFIHNIGGVGKQNEIKDVADGYALNFLIPNGHAVHASAERVKALNERLAVARRAVEDREKKTIQGIERLRGASVRILARANDAGGLYRELTSDMIATAITNSYGVHVPISAIVITEPIKKIGHHTVTIKHSTKSTDVRVDIAKNG